MFVRKSTFLCIVTFYESHICEAYFYVCDLNFLHFHKEKSCVFILWFVKIHISTERYVMTQYCVYR